MFWLCAEFYRGTGRLSRTWIVEANESPDTPEPCEGPDCYCQGNSNAHIPYPFNGMGGRVMSAHDTWDEADLASLELE